MARPATGQVIERESSKGTSYALRFRAYGGRRFLTLGTTAEGWDRARAEVELQNVLADVRRGIWQPPRQDAAPAAERRDPTFHEFASEWYEAKALGLAKNTTEDYRVRLSNHLLPFFARHRLSEITVEEVDRYRRSKERERAALIHERELPGEAAARRAGEAA
jgi:integrase